MFRKIGKRNLVANVHGIRGKSDSIANTLATLHILAVFISFSVCSVLLYVFLLDHLNRIARRELLEELAIVRTLLRTPDGLGVLRKEFEEGRDFEHIRSFVRIVDNTGLIIVEGSEIGKYLPISIFPPPESAPDTVKRKLPNGELYLLKSVRARGKEDGVGKEWEVQIALDISDNEHLAKFIRNALAIFIGGGLAIAILGAIVIVKKGLKPLHAISERIRLITERHLDVRLETDNLPEELSSLAVSFNSMLENLENSFERLSRYTGNLAHELRTPLHSLMVEADLALSRERSSEEYRRVIESSMDEYERLSRVIERLLFLAQADQAQMPTNLVPVDVCVEVEEIMAYFDAVARDKNVAITCSGNLVFPADPVLFRRAISNLLSNALAHTPPGGEIAIEGRRVDSEAVEVIVSDTGEGIEPEHLPKIFERFYRGNQHDKEGARGVGLGLSIVKAIMDLHGGTVSLTSEVGRGTRVVLQFPLAET